jgi:hypothetical protein
MGVAITGGVCLNTERRVQKPAKAAPPKRELVKATQKVPKEKCASLRNGVVVPLAILASGTDTKKLIAEGERLVSADPAVAQLPESRRPRLLLGRASAAFALRREAIAEFEAAALLSETDAEVIEAVNAGSQIACLSNSPEVLRDFENLP